MRALARACSAPTHLAPHSSKASGLMWLMPLEESFRSPVNPGQEPVRTSGAPALTPGALSPSLRSIDARRCAPPDISRERTGAVAFILAADLAGPGGIGL